jgi:hypothetical protein
MLSSSPYLLFSDKQTVPVFNSDCDDTDLTAVRVHLVENTETIVRPKAKLPCRPERYRPLQRLAVAGFPVRLEEQLGFNLRLNQGMVLGLDGPQMSLHLIGIHQSKGLFLRHDDNNHRRNAAPSQSPRSAKT